MPVEYSFNMKSDDEFEEDDCNHGDDAAGYESDYEFHVDQQELIAEFPVVDLLTTTAAKHSAKENWGQEEPEGARMAGYSW
jgi:hypothetical protein